MSSFHPVCAAFSNAPSILFRLKPFGQNPANVNVHSPIIMGMSRFNGPTGNVDNGAPS
jgi:hypothetical protein